MSSPLVWFITGTSTGIGRMLAEAALARGDKVIATARARSLSQIADLKSKGADILELDVTASVDKLNEIAKAAVAIHGRVDVLVNNAGYMLVGAIEENTPEESFDQFNTNVFGALNVARAFLPYMRERRSGTIFWTGSICGWQSLAAGGMYVATKWALKGLSMTLDDEISPLGLRSCCIDYGYFRTSFLNADHRKPYVPRISDYKETTGRIEAKFQAVNNKQPGDPQKGVQIIVDLVHGTGSFKEKPIPRWLVLGSDAYDEAKMYCENSLENLGIWKDVSISTDF
ncbi:short chain dehydrogenase [Mycena floridula]|nr:short chain dehydrogenase [Mycena floridula]